MARFALIASSRAARLVGNRLDAEARRAGACRPQRPALDVLPGGTHAPEVDGASGKGAPKVAHVLLLVAKVALREHDLAALLQIARHLC